MPIRLVDLLQTVGVCLSLLPQELHDQNSRPQPPWCLVGVNLTSVMKSDQQPLYICVLEASEKMTLKTLNPLDGRKRGLSHRRERHTPPSTFPQTSTNQKRKASSTSPARRRRQKGPASEDVASLSPPPSQELPQVQTRARFRSTHVSSQKDRALANGRYLGVSLQTHCH